MLTRLGKVALIILSIPFLFCCWYYVASNYDYDALAGTYTFSRQGVVVNLNLRSDGRFEEEVRTEAGTQRARGRWSRTGMAGADFSVDFIRIPGAKTYIEEFPDFPDGNANDDNSYYGHFDKVLGVYPILHMNANPPGPTLYKKLFR